MENKARPKKKRADRAAAMIRARGATEGMVKIPRVPPPKEKRNKITKKGKKTK